MKTIKILLILLFVAVDYSFAGKKKESYQIDNGVTRVLSKFGLTYFNGSGFMKINANNNVLAYQLEMFTDGKEKQYSIQLIITTLIKRSKAFFFPTNAKLLIKLQDDSIIELSSIYTQNVKDPSQEKACSAHFPPFWGFPVRWYAARSWGKKSPTAPYLKEELKSAKQ